MHESRSTELHLLPLSYIRGIELRGRYGNLVVARPREEGRRSHALYIPARDNSILEFLGGRQLTRAAKWQPALCLWRKTLTIFVGLLSLRSSLRIQNKERYGLLCHRIDSRTFALTTCAFKWRLEASGKAVRRNTPGQTELKHTDRSSL